jgi:molybdopterin-guanine dinucleotide biosynthesis protein A
MAAWNSLAGVIILAGGASRRMGRNKLLLQRDGVPLIGIVVEGVQRQLLARASSVPTIVVGPQPTEGTISPAGFEVVFTREEPPGGGPLAALAAGIAGIGESPGADSVVIVLAGDAPHGPAAMGLLLETFGAIGADHDAVILTDAQGRLQPLCAVYRLRPVRQALAALGDTSGLRMDDLLEQLAIARIPDTVDAALDIDTPDDAERLGFTQG